MCDSSFIYAAAIPEWFFNKEIMIRTADILCVDGRFDKEAVMRFLESKNLHKDIEAFVRTPMIQKWTITFKEKRALDELAKYSPFECDGTHYTASPYEGAEYCLRVHRLPPRIPDTRVVQALKEYVDRVIKINREKVTYKRGKPRVVRNVVVDMNWFQLVKLPHRLEIHNNEVLINLRDREPVCLYCNHTGHIRRQCLFEREFQPYLIAVESPEHPNATIYVNRDSPLARSVGKSSYYGNRSPPKGQNAKSKPKRKSAPVAKTPVVPEAVVSKKVESVAEATVRSEKKATSPFSIWPLFGAFMNAKKSRIIDLRWGLPRFFSATL